MLQKYNLKRIKRSEALISAIIVLALVLGVIVVIHLRARAFHEVTGLQLETGKAYSLAKSGLDIGYNLRPTGGGGGGGGGGGPCGGGSGPSCAELHLIKNYAFGQGASLIVDIDGCNGLITSTGKAGKSVRVLTKSFTPVTGGSGGGGTPPTTWGKIYSSSTGTNGDYARTIRKTSNGYIMHGQTDSWGAGGNDLFLLEIYDNGEISWAKTYGGGGTDEIDKNYGAEAFSDSGGNYVFGGSSKSWTSTYDFLAIKTTTSGGKVWAKTYGTSKADNLYCLRAGISDGYLLGGNTRLVSATKDAMLVIRTNADGTTTGRWSKTYNISSSATSINDIDTFADNSAYVLAGYTEGWGAGSNDGIVIKIDDTGKPLWAFTYGDSRDNKIHSIEKSYDPNTGTQDGFILSGTIYVTSMLFHGFVAKIDLNGTLLWSREFGNDDTMSVRIYEARTDSDKGYVPVGRFLHGSGDYDYLLLKFSPTGSMQWKKIYGNRSDVGNELAMSVDLADGGYILGGYATPYSEPSQIFVVKTASSGAICADCGDFSLDNFTLNYTEANIPGFVGTTIGTPTGNECVNLGCSTNRGIVGVEQAITIKTHGTDFTIGPINTVCPSQ